MVLSIAADAGVLETDGPREGLRHSRAFPLPPPDRDVRLHGSTFSFFFFCGPSDNVFIMCFACEPNSIGESSVVS